MKIDTHQHFWRLDRGDYDWLTPDLETLYRDYLPQDLEPLLAEQGIKGSIVVQAAATEAETEYLLSLSDQYDWILGVVGWVDLAAAHAPDSIARLAKHPKLVGLRPMIQDIADDHWMLQDALRPAINAMVAHNLSFDALVLPRHLPVLLQFLQRYPDLQVIVDHGAKPDIRHQVFEPWGEDIKRIAEHGSVFCKLSGLVTEAAEDWCEADIKPYIEHIVHYFGASRVLFGSDWPVLNLASDYGQWCGVFDKLVAGSGDPLVAYPRLRFLISI